MIALCDPTSISSWIWNVGKGDGIQCIDALVEKVVYPVLHAVFTFTFEWVIGAVAKLFSGVLSLAAVAVARGWMKIPSSLPTGNNSVVQWMHGEFESTAIAPVFVAASVIACAQQIFLSFGERRASGAAVRELGRSLLTLVLVLGMTGLLQGMLLDAGNDYSDWIMKDALGGGTLEDQMGKMFAFGQTNAEDAIAVIILSFAAAWICILQLFAMLFRSVALLLISAVLPLSVSASNTQVGMQAYKTSLAYLTMLMLYKPAAATVFAAAIYTSVHSPSSGSMLNVMTGTTMMLLSTIMMPAMMRLLVPASQVK